MQNQIQKNTNQKQCVKNVKNKQSSSLKNKQQKVNTTSDSSNSLLRFNSEIPPYITTILQPNTDSDSQQNTSTIRNILNAFSKYRTHKKQMRTPKRKILPV